MNPSITIRGGGIITYSVFLQNVSVQKEHLQLIHVHKITKKTQTVIDDLYMNET